MASGHSNLEPVQNSNSLPHLNNENIQKSSPREFTGFLCRKNFTIILNRIVSLPAKIY